MAEPKPFTIAKLFSDLTGQTVNFTQVLKPTLTKAAQAYGLYLIKPMDSTRVVQVDLPLLGSFGGALLGLPAQTVKERLASPTLDEPLRDAVHEVLNVASTIVSIDDRAIFQTMHFGADSLPAGIPESLKNPAFRSYFTVTMNGYEGGAFSIFAPI
jgi:hypothetical protein